MNRPAQLAVHLNRGRGSTKPKLIMSFASVQLYRNQLYPNKDESRLLTSYINGHQNS